MEYLEEKTFSVPILVARKEGLGMTLPPPTFTPRDVEHYVGEFWGFEGGGLGGGGVPLDFSIGDFGGGVRIYRGGEDHRRHRCGETSRLQDAPGGFRRLFGGSPT